MRKHPKSDFGDEAMKPLTSPARIVDLEDPVVMPLAIVCMTVALY